MVFGVGYTFTEHDLGKEIHSISATKIPAEMREKGDLRDMSSVNDNCVKCKHMDCVEVCPVDCFYEGENMLVINPDECIDCGVCLPECPVDAIITDYEDKDNKWYDLNYKWNQYLSFNQHNSKKRRRRTC